MKSRQYVPFLLRDGIHRRLVLHGHADVAARADVVRLVVIEIVVGRREIREENTAHAKQTVRRHKGQNL